MNYLFSEFGETKWTKKPRRSQDLFLGRIQIKLRSWPDLDRHVHGGQTPPVQSGNFLTASMTTTEATTREPQPEATGTIAAPTLTDHSTSYPGGGASKPIMAVAIPTFQPARCSNPIKNRVIDPKTGGYAQDFDNTIAVPVSPVAFQGSLRPPKIP